MALRSLYAAAISGLLLTGCFVESAETRAPIPSAQGANKQESEAGVCRYTVGKGCFDGLILSRNVFRVDGREFFDADNFAPRFAELISIDQGDFKLAEGEKLQIVVQTKIDSEGFLDGFEYDLTGADGSAFVSRGAVRRTGGFSINNVPQGIYDLRIRKPIKFAVVGKVEVLTADTNNPDAEPVRTVKEVSRQYCATLYQDASIEILKGKREQESFNHYKLHVTDLECSTDGNQTRITLK